jgi:hypothetical protein
VTDDSALSRANGEAALAGYRAIRDVLQGARTPVRIDDGLERLTQLATALAALAAAEMTTAWRLRDLDEDEAIAAASADLAERITDLELAMIDGGQIPPPAPRPGEDGT